MRFASISSFRAALIIAPVTVIACAAESSDGPSYNVTDTGGSATGGAIDGIGGTTSTGGVIATGGVVTTGGVLSTGGVATTGGDANTGGVVTTGGDVNTGGTVSTGGDVGSGGITGGTGGDVGTGGEVSTGGIGSGGEVSTGGAVSTGGDVGSGGVTGGTGGDVGTGGVANTGGTGGADCAPITIGPNDVADMWWAGDSETGDIVIGADHKSISDATGIAGLDQWGGPIGWAYISYSFEPLGACVDATDATSISVTVTSQKAAGLRFSLKTESTAVTANHYQAYATFAAGETKTITLLLDGTGLTQSWPGETVEPWDPQHLLQLVVIPLTADANGLAPYDISAKDVVVN